MRCDLGCDGKPALLRPLDARDLETLGQSAGSGSVAAPLDARASVAAKRTAGSTEPGEVARSLDELEAVLADRLAKVAP